MSCRCESSAELLGRLAAADCSISYDRERGCYACASCGGTSEPA